MQNRVKETGFTLEAMLLRIGSSVSGPKTWCAGAEKVGRFNLTGALE